ncbi:MAG: putative quinol monooxygenase [Candidatus Nitrosopolaris sp.]
METTHIEKFKRRSDISVRVIAIFLAKNGLTDQLENILVNLIQPTRKEEGNIAYVLHRSIDNPDELMFDEIWIDKGSLEAHLKQPHVMSALERAASFIAKPIGVRRYSEIRT